VKWHGGVGEGKENFYVIESLPLTFHKARDIGNDGYFKTQCSGNSRRAAFPLPPIRSPLTLSEHHLVHLQLDLVEIRLHRGELRRGFLV
jgi:hypothetical protein